MTESESVDDRTKKRPKFIDKETQCYVFDREVYDSRPIKYRRRDFYKIMYFEGTVRFNYADKGIVIDRPAVLLSNPRIPYSCELLSDDRKGYFCLFTEEFYHRGGDSTVVQDFPLFRIDSDKVFYLNAEQQKYIKQIFQNMLKEFAGEYRYKLDVLRNYLSVLQHEILKMQPSKDYYEYKDASSRITEMFLELLERQFPIDSPLQTMELTSPGDYAQYLSVHVNHLNRAVKKVTGKTTTEHISDRIMNEAKSLLKNTNWNISEIAYSLGYEYPTYFSNKFKQETGTTPSSFR